MAKSKTKKYDVAEYLESEDDMAAYLQAAFEDGDPALVIHALGNIARARGMSQIARETGLRRESLYKSAFARRKSGIRNGSQGGPGAGHQTQCRANARSIAQCLKTDN